MEIFTSCAWNACIWCCYALVTGSLIALAALIAVKVICGGATNDTAVLIRKVDIFVRVGTWETAQASSLVRSALLAGSCAVAANFHVCICGNIRTIVSQPQGKGVSLWKVSGVCFESHDERGWKIIEWRDGVGLGGKSTRCRWVWNGASAINRGKLSRHYDCD